MHKKLLIILSIFTLLLTNVKSDEIVIKQLKKGGNIVFIRHAIAPGGGDPENFRLNDCSTQRNLDSQGIEQSKKMGLFFHSFFSSKFEKNKEKQMKDLNKFLNNWESNKNLILITHYVVILESLNKAVSSGEIVVVDKNLNYIGSVEKY